MFSFSSSSGRWHALPSFFRYLQQTGSPESAAGYSTQWLRTHYIELFPSALYPVDPWALSFVLWDFVAASSHCRVFCCRIDWLGDSGHSSIHQFHKSRFRTHAPRSPGSAHRVGSCNHLSDYPWCRYRSKVQALLVALQISVKVSDHGTAVATFGFARYLATSIGLVVAEAIFQATINKQCSTLKTSLGPTLAKTLTDGGASQRVCSCCTAYCAEDGSVTRILHTRQRCVDLADRF
ncbi:hypothetical protein BDV97DRAFT_75307 [Delphinella strobiligena]|nr:hypothetical protein BDV97DRAFT_75307 [Delphinella strobiligena]